MKIESLEKKIVAQAKEVAQALAPFVAVASEQLRLLEQFKAHPDFTEDRGEKLEGRLDYLKKMMDSIMC